MADDSPEGSQEFSAPSTRTPTEPGNISVTSPASSGDGSAESLQRSLSPEQPGIGALTTFEFISGRDDDSRRRARSHVMRDFMRKKRSRGPEVSRARSSGGTTSAAPGPSNSLVSRTRPPDDLPWSNPGSHHHEGEQRSAGPLLGTPGRGLPADLFSIAPPRTDLSQSVFLTPRSGPRVGSITSNEETARALLAAENPAPQTRIGAGNADPFNSLSYPLVMNAADHQLLHHYITTMPAMLFQAINLDIINPWKDYFQNLGHSNALVLQSLLAFSAAHLAALYGHESTVQSITHKSRLIRMLNEALQSNPPRNTLGALYAIQELAAIENRWGNLSIAPVHYSMVRRLIEVYGGMKAIHANRTLSIAIYTTDLVLVPSATRDRGLPWETLRSSTPRPSPSPTTESPPFPSPPASSSPLIRPPHYTPTPPGLSDTDDLRLACEQFILLLRNVSELSDQTRRQYEILNPQFETWSAPLTLRRVDTFAPGSPIHRLLTSSPFLHRQGVGRGISPQRNLTQDLSCMWVLLYMNLVVWAYRYDSRGLDAYLKNLAVNLVVNELDWNLSVEMLVVVLMNEDLDFESPEEPGWTLWFVSRMVRVAKRLNLASWGKIKGQLLKALVVVDGVQPEVEESTPDEEELRKEILGSLYVGRLLLQ